MLIKFIRSVLLWSAFFTATFFVYVLSANAALEIVDPVTLCERFDVPKEKKGCLNFVKKNAPDTYVASSCGALDDDKVFMECLKFATKAELDPKALEGCSPAKLSDKERMNCLHRLSSKNKDKFQRLPANLKPQAKPKK